MKSKLPTLKQWKALLKTLPKSKLINVCIDFLKEEKEYERSRNIDAAHEIAEYVGVPDYMGGITPKQAIKEMKELGFSLKEIKEMFPRDQYRGLWKKEKKQ